VIDAPAEIAKKRRMQIPSTHGSRLSSLELHSDRLRCGGRESKILQFGPSSAPASGHGSNANGPRAHEQNKHDIPGDREPYAFSLSAMLLAASLIAFTSV
jgi:hypothetical protein